MSEDIKKSEKNIIKDKYVLKRGPNSKNKYKKTTLLRHVYSNTKDVLRKLDDKGDTTSLQAILMATDSVDKAVDTAKTAKKIINIAKNTKLLIEDSKKVVGKNASKSKVNLHKINKKYLLKEVIKRGGKAGLRETFKVRNKIVDKMGDSTDDTNLGINSIVGADRNIRKTIEIGTSIYDTSKSINNFRKKTTNFVSKHVRSFKSDRYNNIKSNVRRSSKIKSNIGSKTILNNAKKDIAKKYILKEAAIANVSKAKSIITASFSALGSMQMILIAGAAFLFMMVAIVVTSGGAILMMTQNFFTSDEDVVKGYKETIDKLDEDLRIKINNSNGYDDIKVIYIGDTENISSNIQELLAIATVYFQQDISFKPEEIEFIKMLHSKTYEVKISSEYYECSGCKRDSDGERYCNGHTRKVVRVYTHNMEEIMESLHFSEEQKEWARRLAGSDIAEQYPRLGIESGGGMSKEDIADIIQNAPKFSSKEQEKLYDTALSLVGKVEYFWGGKSKAGWNDNWGVPTLVTAPGSDQSGKYCPLGLDCSGYTDWVYKTAEIGNMLSAGGTAYQWGQSYPIASNELKVGDLAFLQPPNSSGINHVGIYIGKDKNNSNLYAHCEWGSGVTVNGFKGFRHFRRVVKFD